MVRHARCINPLYDYVPPSLVSILITNTCVAAKRSSFSACASFHDFFFFLKKINE